MFSLQRQIGDSVPHTAMKTRKCQEELINEFEKSLFNVEKRKNKKKTRRQISWNFVSTFSGFVSATSDFFSSKR